MTCSLLIECKWSMKARESPRCEMLWVPTNEEIILHAREIPCLVPCGWDHTFPVISTALRFPESGCSAGYTHRSCSLWKARAFPFPFLGIAHSSFCPRFYVRMGVPFHFFLHVSQWMTPPSLFLVRYEEP